MKIKILSMFFADALITYILTYFGLPLLPINVVVFSILALFLFDEIAEIRINVKLFITSLLLLSQFIIGALISSQSEFQVFSAILNIFIMLITYHILKDKKVSDQFVYYLSIIAIIYLLTSLLTTIGFLPQRYDVGYRLGEEVSRPIIMTDQNYQILYYIPAFCILNYVSKYKVIINIIIFSIIFLIEIYLQSRSGVIFSILAFVISSALFLNKKQILYSFFIFVLLTPIFFYVMYDGLLIYASDFILRIEQTDNSNALDRFQSFLFAFERMSEFKSILIPEGYIEYANQHGGGYPHSFFTSFYLLFGISSLVMMFIVGVALLKVIFAEGIKFNTILFICITYLMVLVTLPSSLFKVNWLIFGLLISRGDICRKKML